MQPPNASTASCILLRAHMWGEATVYCVIESFVEPRLVSLILVCRSDLLKPNACEKANIFVDASILCVLIQKFRVTMFFLN